MSDPKVPGCNQLTFVCTLLIQTLQNQTNKAQHSHIVCSGAKVCSDLKIPGVSLTPLKQCPGLHGALACGPYIYFFFLRLKPTRLSRGKQTEESYHPPPTYTHTDAATESMRAKTWRSGANGTLNMGGGYGAVHISLCRELWQCLYNYICAFLTNLKSF